MVFLNDDGQAVVELKDTDGQAPMETFPFQRGESIIPDADTGFPLEAADRATAETALNAKIRKVVTPVYEKYKENLASAQAELDKPELYQWVSKRCAGWK